MQYKLLELKPINGNPKKFSGISSGFNIGQYAKTDILRYSKGFKNSPLVKSVFGKHRPIL